MPNSYDIVGDADIIGDAVDELLRGASPDDVQGYGEDIVGAPQRAKIRNRMPTKLQRLVIGLGVTAVATLTSAVVTVTPQLPFKIERFISQSTGLNVLDIKVGTNSQFVGSGSIPIEVFARDTVGINLKGDTAVPGVDIALSVSNPTGGSLNIAGAYVGLAAST